ncbi:hypothetical protein DUNSADRAFT_17225 [Dunaliella salina]|uniref:Uncharacterized protein n=1 Tax=Dunaliella salina TaxID=3046 RepID=A0ABQ7G254_DUNSA|nr:hypothetical protein DUNSADRAFT_17225 [Dunaliella salina]|eukprot:KAF5828677.1 hypothetical protein DUNSADRAFT_17225 [Dunaliella salina]
MMYQRIDEWVTEFIMDMQRIVPSLQHSELVSSKHLRLESKKHSELVSSRHSKRVSRKHFKLESKKHSELVSSRHLGLVSSKHFKLVSSKHSKLVSSKHSKLVSSKHLKLESKKHSELVSSRHSKLVSSKHLTKRLSFRKLSLLGTLAVDGKLPLRNVRVQKHTVKLESKKHSGLVSSKHSNFVSSKHLRLESKKHTELVSSRLSKRESSKRLKLERKKHSELAPSARKRHGGRRGRHRHGRHPVCASGMVDTEDAIAMAGTGQEGGGGMPFLRNIPLTRHSISHACVHSMSRHPVRASGMVDTEGATAMADTDSNHSQWSGSSAQTGASSGASPGFTSSTATSSRATHSPGPTSNESRGSHNEVPSPAAACASSTPISTSHTNCKHGKGSSSSQQAVESSTNKPVHDKQGSGSRDSDADEHLHTREPSLGNGPDSTQDHRGAHAKQGHSTSPPRASPTSGPSQGSSTASSAAHGTSKPPRHPTSKTPNSHKGRSEAQSEAESKGDAHNASPSSGSAVPSLPPLNGTAKAPGPSATPDSKQPGLRTIGHPTRLDFARMRFLTLVLGHGSPCSSSQRGVAVRPTHRVGYRAGGSSTPGSSSSSPYKAGRTREGGTMRRVSSRSSCSDGSAVERSSAGSISHKRRLQEEAGEVDQVRSTDDSTMHYLYDPDIVSFNPAELPVPLHRAGSMSDVKIFGLCKKMDSEQAIKYPLIIVFLFAITL